MNIKVNSKVFSNGVNGVVTGFIDVAGTEIALIAMEDGRRISVPTNNIKDMRSIVISAK